MINVEIYGGICGFTTMVHAEDQTGYKASFRLESECPNWKKVDEILELDARAWEIRARGIEEEDKRISEGFVDQGLSHYAIKYNRFMGVISDYFTTED